MTDSVSHLAGNVINLGGRVIQRCSICGEKLTDTKGQMVPLNADGTIAACSGASWWPVGEWIRFLPGKQVVAQTWNNKPPSDNCIVLVEH